MIIMPQKIFLCVFLGGGGVAGRCRVLDIWLRNGEEEGRIVKERGGRGIGELFVSLGEFFFIASEGVAKSIMVWFGLVRFGFVSCGLARLGYI